MEHHKVKSGVPGLDAMLSGGFSKNSVVAVAGGTGSGRTIFCSQFLVAGASEFEEPGLFISLDMQKEQLYSNLAAFGWDMAELERDQLLVFIDYPQNELASIAEQEGAMRDLVNTLGIKRVVVDSISPYALLFSTPEERKMNTLRFVNAVRGWKATALISAETVPSHESEVPHTISGVESFADGLIHLSFLRKGGRRERALEIVKMRGSSHEHDIVPAQITQHGFSVGMMASKKAKRGPSDE